MRTRQKCVATDTWRSLGCRTTPLEHWSRRKPTVEPRWAKQQTKKLRLKPTKTSKFSEFSSPAFEICFGVLSLADKRIAPGWRFHACLGKGQGQTHNLISRAHVLKYMQAEYEHSILNVFQVMITNSRVDTRVDVSEQTNGQTNVRKLAHLYGAAEADATKSRKCLWTY